MIKAVTDRLQTAVILCWSIVFWMFLFCSSGFAEEIKLSQLQSPLAKNSSNWRLIFVSKTPIFYHYTYQNDPKKQLLLNIHNDTVFYQMVNPSQFIYSPIAALRWSILPAQHVQLTFDLRQPIMVHMFSLRTPQNTYRLIVDLKKNIGITQAPRTSHPTFAATTPFTAIHQPALRRIMVVIDPGHGGKDPGAIGVRGIMEKQIVLNIAKQLKILVNRQPGFQAVLTRQGDYFLSLRQRLAVARHYKADLFIAIHADIGHSQNASGATVYALSSRGATSEAARWLAAHENQSELMGGVKLTQQEDVLRSVLINLSQTATIQTSLMVGQNLLAALHPLTRLHYRGVEQAAFVVLKSPDIPSVLIETGYLSNVKEAYKLYNPTYQQWLASALMQGIKTYFTQSPPPGTQLANRRWNHPQYAAQKQLLNFHKSEG